MNDRAILRALAGLAQETRLSIFRLLVERGPEGIAAGMIAEGLEIPPATLSFHLKELTNADLVTSDQRGRFVYYRANYATMNGVIAYLTENCCQGTACDIACAPAGTRKRRAS